MAYAKDETAWLLPELQGDNSGSKLTGYIKAMQVGKGGKATYQHVAVSSLPEQPTAAGFRHGAADTLASSVPAELAVHNTGHDLTSLSALWEYLRARIALLVPGAIVLAGWKPLPYGQLGKGPVHPTLDALIGVPISELDTMIDALFNLTKYSLPKLCVGGELRPMLHATLATMIMYYEERMGSPLEMAYVLDTMRQSYSIIGVGTDPHGKLIEWGKAIRKQFNSDNLHLTQRHEHTELGRVIDVVQELGSTVADLGTKVADMATRQRQMETRQRQMDRKIDMIIELLQGSTVTTPSPAPLPQNASLSSLPPSQPPLPSQPRASSAPSQPPLPSQPRSPSQPPPSQPPPSQPRPSFQPSSSMASSSSAPHAPLNKFLQYKTTGKKAMTLYLDIMHENHGNLPKCADDRKGKRKSDCETCFKLYDAMARDSERETMKSAQGSVREKTEIVKQLTKLIVV